MLYDQNIVRLFNKLYDPCMTSVKNKECTPKEVIQLLGILIANFIENGNDIVISKVNTNGRDHNGKLI